MNDGRGRVIRPDDRRIGKHSPEHRAAITAGIERTVMSHEQQRLAIAGEPHRFVPWAPVRVPKPYTLAYGGCWACWWGQRGDRTQDEMTALTASPMAVEHIGAPVPQRKVV